MQAFYVSALIKDLRGQLSPPTVKQHWDVMTAHSIDSLISGSTAGHTRYELRLCFITLAYSFTLPAC